MPPTKGIWLTTKNGVVDVSTGTCSIDANGCAIVTVGAVVTTYAPGEWTKLVRNT